MAILENARHEKFVQCLIAGESQRSAYRQAFKKANRWKDATVDSKASLLFNNGKILARYQELQEQAQDEAILTRKERMICLSDIASQEESNNTDRIKAIDTLNKMDGIYTNKVELSGSVELSAADREKIMRQRLEELRNNE